MMKKVKVLTAIIILASVSALSCIRQKTPASRGKSTNSCNLESAAEETRKQSAASFGCAYDALSAAAKLAGGSPKVVQEIVSGVLDLVKGIDGLARLVNSSKDSDATQTAVDLSNGTASPGKLSGNQILACFGDVASFSKDLSTVLKAAREISISNENSFSSGALLGMSIAFDGLKSIGSVIESGMDCAAIAGADDELKASLNAVKNITNHLDAIKALSQCSVTLAQSGLFLFNNSWCALEDLSSLRQSNDSVARQVKITLDTPARRDDTRDGYRCNGEPDGNNLFAMTKYGMILYRDQISRSVDPNAGPANCGAYCANTQSAADRFRRSINAILGDDMDVCGHLAGIPQGQAAIAQCVSYCCNQEGSCTNAALAGMK